MNYGVALNITILNWEKCGEICGSIKMEYFRDDAGGGHIITYTIHHRHFQLCFVDTFRFMEIGSNKFSCFWIENILLK